MESSNKSIIHGTNESNPSNLQPRLVFHTTRTATLKPQKIGGVENNELQNCLTSRSTRRRLYSVPFSFPIPFKHSHPNIKIVNIYWRDTALKRIIKLDELEDQHEKKLELPPDPENNLVFDPRSFSSPYFPNTYTVEFQDSERLVITRAEVINYIWGNVDLYFRVYDRTKEDVPAAFDSSIPYEYWGLRREVAPYDARVVKVHPTVTAIGYGAFDRCEEMTACDMSNAPIKEIDLEAFSVCSSLTSILFSWVLKKIGERAFSYCEALDVLVIPSTVTNIAHYAFISCRNMRILKLPDAIDLDNVRDDIISDCPLLLDKVPANQTKTPKHWLKHRYDPYPLHKVCYNAHVTVEEIQQCILAHPHAAYLSDDFDMTALHMITIMACTSNMQIESHNQDQDQDQDHGETPLGGIGHITACFDANMSAAFVEDDRGKTPLDYLLESCDGLDVHTALVTSLCLHRSALQ